jgi:aryl-alcohol dehydrogenase-like predicted oxidoreductase
MLTEFFDPLKPALVELNSVAAGSGKTVLELVLAKIRHHSSVDGVLVGATNLQELKEINQSWNATGDFFDFELPKVPVAILDPRTWPQMRITP